MKDYYGIKVDVDQLANGLYKLILNDENGACLRLGMFPHNIMECFEFCLKDKVPDEFFNKRDDELNIYSGKTVRQEITHDVCCKVLAIASNDGFCIV